MRVPSRGPYDGSPQCPDTGCDEGVCDDGAGAGAKESVAGAVVFAGGVAVASFVAVVFMVVFVVVLVRVGGVLLRSEVGGVGIVVRRWVLLLLIGCVSLGHPMEAAVEGVGGTYMLWVALRRVGRVIVLAGVVLVAVVSLLPWCMALWRMLLLLIVVSVVLFRRHWRALRTRWLLWLLWLLIVRCIWRRGAVWVRWEVPSTRVVILCRHGSLLIRVRNCRILDMGGEGVAKRFGWG